MTRSLLLSLAVTVAIVAYCGSKPSATADDSKRDPNGQVATRADMDGGQRAAASGSTPHSRMFAGETGGRASLDRNEPSLGFERMMRDSSTYYMLGYNSSNPDPFKYVRRVEIKSKREGLTLDYRHEYSLKRPSKKPKK